ncbi:MAG: immunoglobulin-like domain-containing protein, partial [Clostridiaceae bacterium]
KYITLTSADYPGLRDFRHGNWIMWTDNDLKHGTNYDYIVSSATDMLGNKSDNTVDAWKISATLDSAETLVKETQDWIYANLQQPQNSLFYQPHIVFAPGDSQESVTQKIDLPVSGIVSFGTNSIEWTSDRPDIIKVAKNGYNEVNLPVDENGNPAEAKVTLTGKITYTIYNANESAPVTATGTVTVPVNVKWNIVDGQVIVATEYSESVPDSDEDGNADDTYVNDPIKEINKAVNFDDSIAKTILLKHAVDINREPKSLVNGWSKLGDPRDIVIDCHGKTIKADFDGALFRITQNGGSFTLKNAVIDMNNKNGTILMSDSYPCKKVLENVKVINAENCQYGVVLGSVSENAVTDDGKAAENSFTADKCEFSSFGTAAIAAYNSMYSYTYNDANYHTSFKYEPTPVKISNCTFDGEGKPGYAVVDAFGKVSIDNSTFRNYKGNVSTGWNSSNDSYERSTKDGDGNYCYLYKGIPDASPSAAVLVKELGSADLKGNTVKGCDNSILVWTGEKNFSFLEQKPDSSFTAYCTVNGVKVDSTTAGEAADSLFKANTINGVEGSTDNRIVISDASDRYNLVTLAEKSYVPETAAPEAIEGSTSNTAAIPNDTSGTSLSTSTSAESVGNAIERTSTGSGIISKESASAVNPAGTTEQTNKDNIAGSIKSDNTNKVSDINKETKNFFGNITVTNWVMLAAAFILMIVRGIFIFRNKKTRV